MALTTLKAIAQKCFHSLGYHIERYHERVDAPIDVLDLLLTKISAERPDFFFVQVGANDGLTDDPIRQYVLRHHWRGVLVEPQPNVFQLLTRNYENEKQLTFVNAALADRDGTICLFVADHDDPAANLTVFASLKQDALTRRLGSRKAAGVQTLVKQISVPALSVRTLIDQHRISRIDLLQTDVQGYDREVVEQFLDHGVKPSVIHFEHCHTPRGALHNLYRRLVVEGYRYNEFEHDTVAVQHERIQNRQTDR